jgi:phage-related protein
MGDDTSHATFVMKEAMSGLNGDFQTLKEQFGITADKMKAAGWSGAADDVQGYRQALETCLSGLGDMGQVMDTTSGKINRIKSNFSSAGLEIGNTMLPAVDWVASAFLDANENGNLLAKGILYAGGAASAFASLAPTLKPMFDTYDSIKGAVEKAKGATELLTKATETMNGITAVLTGTKAAETVATEADAVAETTDAAAKSANTVATEADAAANVTLAGALSGAASSAWALTVALLHNPLTWVAIAVIALVAVMWHLYNTNEDVRNGLNDIWNIISGGLGDAWNALSGAVTAFANALVPVVMAIINFVKWFALLFTDFPAAQQQFRDFINNIGNIVLQGLSNLGMMIANAFMSIRLSLASTFMTVIMNIQNWLTQARMIAGMLVGMLVSWVVTRFNLLVARVRNIFTMVVNAIRTRLSNARNIATNLAQMIRQNIVNRFNQIIARVRTIFQNIVSTIRSRLSNAVSTARQKAQEILQGIKDKITNIPQIVADEFNKIKSRISSALSSAASAAASGAAGIVNAFKRALGIASPGYVQRMTAAEFATLPVHIADSGVRAIGETTRMARGIVSAWNGNMTNLSVGWENGLNSGIPQFNAFSPANLQQVDLGVTGQNFGNILSSQNGVNSNSTNYTTNSDNHATHIHVENISLDYNNLTKQESRQIL